VTADDPEHLGHVVAHRELGVWLDVDVGMHRTGSAPEVWRRWASANASTRVVGIQAYEGHVGWRDAASAIYDDVAALARDVGGCTWILTSGSLAFAHALGSNALRETGAIHQIGAGTLVLGDVASREPAAAIGAAPSTFVAARVVAKPGEGRITLDAGSKAIAPDRPPPACAVLGHPTWRPLRASEEHLPIEIGDDAPPARDAIVLLVPDHVCTTVNLYRGVVYLRDGVPCGTGTIEAAGRELPKDGEHHA
jgi:D-serine deaminase-like pyridoxal phosphate-dependent protein